jgi:glycosyltransferase involved in cell wall biosynthesis
VRVIQTIASTRLDHGGTSRSVPALCDALAELGVDVQLVAGRPADAAIACGWPGDASRVHTVCESPVARSWGMGQRFRSQLASVAASNEDLIIHDHGLWLATNHAVAAFARGRRAIRVVSPRGMLSRWALGSGRLKKRLAWLAYQRRDLATATAFHATSDEEAAEIRSLGFAQPIAVIPNGIKFPVSMPARAADAGRRTMLFLSRIHPKKGLLNLVRAWHAATPGPEWRLVIAGPDDGGHRSEVERLVGELGLREQVTFPGEIADADKWAAYAAADVFVLPSFSENFGLVVAEALAAGTPVIATTGTPWQELSEAEAGWQVAPTVEALREAIGKATAAPSDLLGAMGQRGAKWVRRRFAWSDVARQMTAFYRSLEACGEKPACARTNELVATIPL